MKTILLIEENQQVRDQTSALLKLNYNNVITAKNGDEGVELAEKVKPDMIICDGLSKMLDGRYVMEILSKNSKTASIPFITMD